MRIGRAICAALAIAALAVTGAAAAADTRRVTIATLTAYPPYSGEKLPHQGVSTQIVRAAFERAGYAPEVTVMPWPRALEMVKQGKYDALANVWHREHRTEFFHYADVLATNRLVFVKQNGADFTYDTLNDLKGKTIGIVRDYNYPDSFVNANFFHREAFDSLRDSLAMAARGRVDLAVGDSLVVQHIINTEMPPDLANRLELTEGALSEDPMHLAVSRKIPNHAEIVDRFNAALAEMRADGTHAAILDEHGLDLR